MQDGYCGTFANSQKIRPGASRRRKAFLVVSNRSTDVALDGTPERPRIKRIFRDSVESNAEELRGAVDFIFIDGSHSLECVKNDTEKAFDMLALNGTIG